MSVTVTVEPQTTGTLAAEWGDLARKSASGIFATPEWHGAVRAGFGNRGQALLMTSGWPLPRNESAAVRSQHAARGSQHLTRSAVCVEHDSCGCRPAGQRHFDLDPSLSVPSGLEMTGTSKELNAV